MTLDDVIREAVAKLEAQASPEILEGSEVLQDEIMHEIAEETLPAHTADLLSVASSSPKAREVSDYGLVEGVTDIETFIRAAIFEVLQDSLAERFDELREGRNQ